MIATSPAVSRGAGTFGMPCDTALPPKSQLIYQSGPQLRPIPKDGDAETGQHMRTDLGYRSVASEMCPQPVSWMNQGSCVPSASAQNMFDEMPLERMPFVDFSSLPRHGTFPGLMPNVSVQSGFLGSSVEGGSGILTGVQQPAFLGLPCNVPTTMAAPSCHPQLQAPPQHDAYLCDTEELALGMQPSVVPAPTSLPTQQAIFQPPMHPAQMPSMGLNPPPLRDDPACIGSLQLPADLQPVRLLLPPPTMPSRPPPLLMTSGQPSNLSIAVAPPLAVGQETPSTELRPMPVFPAPAQFMMEHPQLSVHMHEVPRPGLMTEESPVKLQSSSMIGLMPPFQSDASVRSRLDLNVVLQDRPPVMGRMPSLGPVGEVPGRQQNAILDSAPAGMIRPPRLMPNFPQPLMDILCRPIGQLLSAPELVPEMPEVCERQKDADLRLPDTSDQYPGAGILPDQPSEMPHESDRRFGVPAKPLMAPGQMLEALQRLPAPETQLLPGPPSHDLSPMRAPELGSPEFGGVLHMTLPVLEHNDLPTDGHLEQRSSSFFSSTFSSRLPAPAVVMASTEVIGSRLPEDQFPSEFRHHNFDNWQESDLSLEQRGGNASMDRVGPFSHIASVSGNLSSTQPSFEHTRVPSLLDTKLLQLSQSSHLDQSTGPRWWKDLKATMRQRTDWNRRRTFHRFNDTDEVEDFASSYEPPSKLLRSDGSIAAETEDVPPESASECDRGGNDDTVTVSSTIDAAPTAVTEPSSSCSSTELS